MIPDLSLEDIVFICVLLGVAVGVIFLADMGIAWLFDKIFGKKKKDNDQLY